MHRFANQVGGHYVDWKPFRFVYRGKHTSRSVEKQPNYFVGLWRDAVFAFTTMNAAGM